MKKILFLAAIFTLSLTPVFADVFEANQEPVEVKLAPAVTTSSSENAPVQKAVEQSVQPVVNEVKKAPTTIKEQKFTNALVNLDDAQVELRQELAIVTAKYNEAINDKNKCIQNCRNLKKEINAINKKMKNIEKSKKMINQNLDGNE